MKYIQIINPKAGHGEAVTKDLNKEDLIKYTTKCVGDAERYVIECCENTEEDLNFIICGGDGTLNEVVNGIMAAKANDRASFSVMPTGSGNDFVRAFDKYGDEYIIDLIKYNGRYAANMLNIGFDCDVVKKTSHYKNKKLISGSMAYILGIINVLCHKMGKNFKITVTDSEDMVKNFDHPCLLTAIGNLPYCGGGFKALPLARGDDGLIDLLIVKKISRRKFISLIGDYRKGTFLDSESGKPIKKFQNIIQYIKCRKITVENTESICADGEVEAGDKVSIEILPKAIKYIHIKSE